MKRQGHLEVELVAYKTSQSLEYVTSDASLSLFPHFAAAILEEYARREGLSTEEAIRETENIIEKS